MKSRSIPIPDQDMEGSREQNILQGDVPSPIDIPSGYRFRTRYPNVMDVCSKIDSVYREAEPNHFVAYHLYDETVISREDAVALHDR